MPPFYFLMTEGEYDGYRPAALYACFHKVTTEDWQAFSREEYAIRQVKRQEICTEDNPKNRVLHDKVMWDQIKQFQEWERERGSIAKLFIAKHNMQAVPYVELYEGGSDFSG